MSSVSSTPANTPSPLYALPAPEKVGQDDDPLFTGTRKVSVGEGRVVTADLAP